MGNPVGALAVATGKTNLSLYYTILRCLVTLPCVYIASCLGITAVAWSNCLLGAVMFLLSWKIQISQMIGLRLKDYLSSFRKEITIAFFIVVPLYVFFSGDYIPSLNSVYTQLLLYGAIFFGLYKYDEIFSETLERHQKSGLNLWIFIIEMVIFGNLRQ